MRRLLLFDIDGTLVWGGPAKLAFGQAMIEGSKFRGYRKVIDLSADSANNWSGIPIADARAKAIAAGIDQGLEQFCLFGRTFRE